MDAVTVFPDHLEVTVAGAPPLNVLYSEVGLKESETVRACRRAEVYSAPTAVFRTELALAG